MCLCVSVYVCVCVFLLKDVVSMMHALADGLRCFRPEVETVLVLGVGTFSAWTAGLVMMWEAVGVAMGKEAYAGLLVWVCVCVCGGGKIFVLKDIVTTKFALSDGFRAHHPDVQMSLYWQSDLAKWGRLPLSFCGKVWA